MSRSSFGFEITFYFGFGSRMAQLNKRDRLLGSVLGCVHSNRRGDTCKVNARERNDGLVSPELKRRSRSVLHADGLAIGPTLDFNGVASKQTAADSWDGCCAAAAQRVRNPSSSSPFPPSVITVQPANNVKERKRHDQPF